ncbi:hypothetical protein [Streptomyces canus]|uniref:hypothetical protein n=1 Tax=Streptomyces canus TaxID=58343 RepID=UPI00286F0577|nr:hypothetical protein [Streptomyces canus]
MARILPSFSASEDWVIRAVTEKVGERRPSGVAAINWVYPSVSPVGPRTTPHRVSYPSSGVECSRRGA